MLELRCRTNTALYEGRGAKESQHMQVLFILQQNAFMLSDTILVGTRYQNDLGVGVVNVRFSKIYHSIYASTNFPKWHETPHFVKLCSCAGNACQVEQRQCSLFKKQVLRDNAT
jgi:hypothetical protein